MTRHLPSPGGVPADPDIPDGDADANVAAPSPAAGPSGGAGADHAWAAPLTPGPPPEIPLPAAGLGGLDRSTDPNLGHLLPPAPDEPGEGHRLVVLERGNPDAPTWAAERLVGGGVVAFPTDTVYGLGASLAKASALARVFAIKGRPAERVLPVLLASVDDLAIVARDPLPDVRLLTLLDRYWPGPLTVVVPARAGLPAEVVAPDGTVGTRVPNHPLALRLLEAAGGAIAATSANRSGEPPLGTAGEVAAVLGDVLDLLLDGGPTPGLLPSSVVRIDGDDLVILREGAIPAAELREAWAAAREG